MMVNSEKQSADFITIVKCVGNLLSKYKIAQNICYRFIQSHTDRVRESFSVHVSSKRITEEKRRDFHGTVTCQLWISKHRYCRSPRGNYMQINCRKFKEDIYIAFINLIKIRSLLYLFYYILQLTSRLMRSCPVSSFQQTNQR